MSTLSRRSTLKLLLASTALPLFASPVLAQASGVRAIVLSDLHSAYERFSQLLEAVRAEVAANATPTVIVINGDVFELGNVAATRSGGEADWAFLERLGKVAPLVINIGNHEPDFDNDLANYVKKATELGITVLSNITDSRTGQPYAPASAALEVGGQKVTIAAIATDAINTYPKATREMLTIPAPATWAAENLPNILKADGFNIVLSHAGVVADRQILPLLPEGTLLVGGHDHLRLTHEAGATRYVHTGSWSSLMTVATMTTPGQAPELAQVEIDTDGAADAELSAMITAVLDKHLTAEERATIGTAPKDMTLGETGRYVAAQIAAAAGADVGFIGHTSFGTGFAEGPVTLFDYNAVLRFEGKIVTAEVDAATLREILQRTNQDGDLPLEARTGDFLYASPEDVPEKATYVIAGNDWSFINQKNYFGREDLKFTEVSGMMLKPTIQASLQ